jgi:thymidylate synthase
MLKNLVQKLYTHEEEQYLELIKDLLQNGSLEKGRNGNTICGIGSAMYFSLKDKKIPILTTKKVAMKTCIKELLWFIQGHTNNKLLKEQNVHIWDLNGTKSFLESRNLPYEEDDLGPVYGHQWRHFNASYGSCEDDYTNKGVDQLDRVLADLKNPETRSSRRHVISAWNPCQMDKMALPPCHVLFQFHVTNGNQLSCSLYQRSGDVGLGVPFNIMSYAAFTILVAKHCDLEPLEFIYYLGNTHIYEEHKEALETQIQRVPFPFPSLHIKEKKDNINDYTIDDFKVEDYQYHASIKMKMNQ